MHYPELVDIVSVRTGIRKDDVSSIIRSACETIAEKVLDGEVISVPCFGKFIKRGPKERTFRNPRTGDKMVKLVSTIAYRPAQSIKKQLSSDPVDA